MDETVFNREADLVLNHLADTIDEHLGDRIDVEMQSGILTLEVKGGGQYVINKHGPNREIWLSSPVSGAAHFKAIDGGWRSTRQADVDLIALLSRELGLSL